VASTLFYIVGCIGSLVFSCLLPMGC